MRKLLQSKLAVTVLALVAIVMIGRPFWQRPATAFARAAADPADEMSPPDEEAPLALAADAGTPAPLPSSWSISEVARLASEPSRDPFLRGFVPPDDSLAQVVIAVVLPTLQAISRQGDRTYAVIDRRLVAEGGSVSGFVVTAILAHEVLVRRDGGKEDFRLSLYPAKALATSESELRPKADSADTSRADAARAGRPPAIASAPSAPLRP